ncbi:MAG: helix-turn-helix transcriptional regulator [Pseudomonadota bacterium]
MTSPATFFDDTQDLDTLGGRIVRAREATGLDAMETSERVGVTIETYENWEMDRDEPRANKLAMLAGCLGVSPTWLLSGIGEAPISESTSEELENLKHQLDRIYELHQQTGHAIDMLSQAIRRLADREE